MIRYATGGGYRWCQITILPSEADALAPLFGKKGSIRLGPALMGALATLIHEELHAVHYAGWPGIAQDLLIDAPGIKQLCEGVVDAGVETFFPSLLPRLGLAGLKKALPLLQVRRAYDAEKLAVRYLLGSIATRLNVPTDDLLKRTLQWGSRMIALRNLAHDLARAERLADRIPDWKWPVVRLQRQLPNGAESRIIREILVPFAELGRRAGGGQAYGDAARQIGLETAEAAIQRLEGCLRQAA